MSLHWVRVLGFGVLVLMALVPAESCHAGDTESLLRTLEPIPDRDEWLRQLEVSTGSERERAALALRDFAGQLRRPLVRLLRSGSCPKWEECLLTPLVAGEMPKIGADLTAMLKDRGSARLVASLFIGEHAPELKDLLPVVRQCLRDSDSDAERVVYLGALAASRGMQDAEVRLAGLLKSTRESVRWEAAMWLRHARAGPWRGVVLGMLPKAASNEELEALLHALSTHGIPRVGATTHLRRLATRAPLGVHEALAARVLANHSEADRDWLVERAANDVDRRPRYTRALSDLSRQSLVGLCNRAAQSGSPEQITVAIEVLENSRVALPLSLVLRLTEVAQVSPETTERMALASSSLLGRIDEGFGTDAAVRTLDSLARASEGARAVLVSSLPAGITVDVQLLSRLKTLLSSGSEQLRAAAASLIERSTLRGAISAEVRDLLLESHESESQELRMYVLAALAAHGYVTSPTDPRLSDLQTALRHRSARVRRAALQALARLGDHARTLMKGLPDERPGSRLWVRSIEVRSGVVGGARWALRQYISFLVTQRANRDLVAVVLPSIVRASRRLSPRSNEFVPVVDALRARSRTMELFRLYTEFRSAVGGS